MTVYDVPTLAPLLTVKPPASVPPTIEQFWVANRLLGLAVRRQVVPSQLRPEAVMPLPGGPDIELKTKVGAGGTVNVAEPKSPVRPVTVTV